MIEFGLVQHTPDPMSVHLGLESTGPYSISGFPYLKLDAFKGVLDMPIGEVIPDKLILVSGASMLGVEAKTTIAYDPASLRFGFSSTLKGSVKPQVYLFASNPSNPKLLYKIFLFTLSNTLRSIDELVCSPMVHQTMVCNLGSQQ